MTGQRKVKETISLEEFARRLFTWNYLKGLVIDPGRLPLGAFLIIFLEVVITSIIVYDVPYTEIDWKAYMQECEGFLNGTYDYSKLHGDTGPLVYPAGFVYIYSFFYFLTDKGENILLAQCIFMGIYLLQIYFVMKIHIKTKKVPAYALLIATISSYRIHSIYVLRLFNDPIAVLLLYISLNLFLNSNWTLGSIFYSLGVSVKMNILLYAPALFLFYVINLGFKNTMKQIFVCGIVQLILGLPFLMTAPVEYLKGSFDLGRVFNHTWTVNYRFLDVETFESKCFHLTLLGIHLLLLIIFLPMCIKYFKSYCRLKYIQNQVQPQIDAKNLENKRKSKLNKDAKRKLAKKTEDEILTKEQEDFLNSFESMLKKSSPKDLNAKRGPKKHHEPEEETNYSIDFDILSQLFILPMFIVNFIGIVCARSLHYQFYTWYYHSLPYLLWSTNFPVVFRFLILFLIEYCWIVYPSTDFSSALLHVCHITILFGVYRKLSFELKLVSKVQ